MRSLPAPQPLQEPPARRRLWRAAGLAVGLLLTARAAAVAPRLPPEDEALLDAVQRRGVAYFAEQSHPFSGLTRDRAPWREGDGASSAPSSVAATGFALSVWCIGEERGWLAPGEARRRALAALRTVADRHAHERGWLYHFVDPATGGRVWRSEASTIDTALFLQGALHAREHLRDPEITALVARIYSRIDWPWALNGGSALSHVQFDDAPGITGVTAAAIADAATRGARLRMIAERQKLNSYQ